jgi:type II secretory pathway component PulM
VSVVVVLLVLAVVVWLLMSPLRGGEQRAAAAGAERDELEALKEAKYAEIRDAELDYRTGKLSEADWRALDRSLRAEAVELLDRLDALE